MFQQIIKFIVANKIPLFIPVLLLIVVLLISSIEKSKRVQWISLIVTLISIGGFIFTILESTKLFGYDVIVYLSGFCLLTLFYNVILYFKTTSRFNKHIKLIKFTPSNIENDIYAYLDEQSKFIMLTDQFFENFEGLKITIRTVKKTISHLLCDDKKMSYKDFKKYVKSNAEKNYHLKIVLLDSKILKFEILKRKVIRNGKLLGYVLINQKPTLKVHKSLEIPEEITNKNSLAGVSKDIIKQNLLIYFNLLNQSSCYLDFEKKQYILTKTMSDALDIKGDILAEPDLNNYIFEEDKSIILKRIITENITKNFYRLKTVNGLEWFEENTLSIDENNYIVIHQTSFSNYRYKFKNTSDLIEDIKLNYKQTEECSLVFISINDLPRIIQKIGYDAAEYVISIYFDKINEYKQKIYKVGTYEFCIIVNKPELYDMMLKDLSSNNSNLLGLDVHLNDLKFQLKNSVGLVESKNVENFNPESIIQAGFDALVYATDDKYPKRYSIYYPKKTDSVDFNDAEIDLSDQFLDKILTTKK